VCSVISHNSGSIVPLEVETGDILNKKRKHYAPEEEAAERSQKNHRIHDKRRGILLVRLFSFLYHRQRSQRQFLLGQVSIDRCRLDGKLLASALLGIS
jgi:hypothetical protein